MKYNFLDFHNIAISGDTLLHTTGLWRWNIANGLNVSIVDSVNYCFSRYPLPLFTRYSDWENAQVASLHKLLTREHFYACRQQYLQRHPSPPRDMVKLSGFISRCYVILITLLLIVDLVPPTKQPQSPPFIHSALHTSKLPTYSSISSSSSSFWCSIFHLFIASASL